MLNPAPCDDKENTPTDPNVIDMVEAKNEKVEAPMKVHSNPIDNVVSVITAASQIIHVAETPLSKKCKSKSKKMLPASATKAIRPSKKIITNVRKNAVASTNKFSSKSVVVDDDNESVVSMESCKESMSVDTGAVKAAIRKAKQLKATKKNTVPTSKSSNEFLKSTKVSMAKARSRVVPACNTAICSNKPLSLTCPKSPRFAPGKRPKSTVMSTEERELLEIDNARRVAELRTKKNKSNFEKVKAGPATTVIRSTKELTIPVTPVSHLTRRLGQKTIVSDAPVVAVSVVSTGPRQLTQPEPFQLAINSRIPVNAPVESVLTSAELNQKFMQDPRSHYVPAKACSKLTTGKAPVFKTDIRAASGYSKKPLSHDEIVALEMEKINKNPFKALPLDRKIFESMGEIGVPKVAVKATTEPVAFEFRTDKRLGSKVIATEPKSPEQAGSTKQPWVPRVTQAVSPKLSGSNSAAAAPARRQLPHHSILEKEKMMANTFSSQSTQPLKLTQPKEFHLTTSDRYHMHKKQLEDRLKIEREQEEKSHVIQSKPVPSSLYKPYKVYKVEPKVTQTEEFQLRSVMRHADAKEAFSAKATRILKEDYTTFHAKPLPKSTFEPEVVATPAAPSAVTQPMPVQLESDKRALKRKEYNDMMALRSQEMEKKREEEEKRQIEKENLEINQLRRLSVKEGGMAFKANPIVTKDKYPCAHVKAAPVTQPKSPYLLTKQRAKTN